MDKLERTTKTTLALCIVTILVFSGLTMIACLDYDRNIHMTRVACVGDSITMASTYPEKLQGMLGAYYKVENFGLSGSTVTRDSKLPYLEQSQFEKAKDFLPDIVLILLGTNDANPEVVYDEATFQADYTEIVKGFLDLETKPKVVIVNSPPMFVYDPSPYNNTYLTTEIFPKIEYVADVYDLPTVDLYSMFGNRSDYFMDGIHPTDNGAKLIASTLCQTVINIHDEEE